MHILLWVGLCGLLAPIVGVSFEHNIASGIVSTIAALCLAVSVGYFIIKGNSANES